MNELKPREAARYLPWEYRKVKSSFDIYTKAHASIEPIQVAALVPTRALAIEICRHHNSVLLVLDAWEAGSS